MTRVGAEQLHVRDATFDHSPRPIRTQHSRYVSHTHQSRKRPQRSGVAGENAPLLAEMAEQEARDNAAKARIVSHLNADHHDSVRHPTRVRQIR